MACILWRQNRRLTGPSAGSNLGDGCVCGLVSGGQKVSAKCKKNRYLPTQFESREDGFLW